MNKENTGTSNCSDDKVVRDRAIRLFTYLRELTELNTKTIRTSDQYEKVLWFDDIPREMGCHSIAWGPVDEEKSDVWIEIRKPRLKGPPEAPEILKPWLDPPAPGMTYLVGIFSPSLNANDDISIAPSPEIFFIGNKKATTIKKINPKSFFKLITPS